MSVQLDDVGLLPELRLNSHIAVLKIQCLEPGLGVQMSAGQHTRCHVTGRQFGVLKLCHAMVV